MTAPEDRPDELTKAQRLIVAEELVNALTARLVAAEARLEAAEAEAANVASDLTTWLVYTPPSAPLKAPIIKARNRLRQAAALSVAPQPQPARECGNAHVGDTVTATLRGKLIDFDVDMGVWTLETDGVDHIPWQFELHWAQPFEVVHCPEAQS